MSKKILGELKLVRLKNQIEDLIGYVKYYDEYLIIETPLRIDIDTIFEESRQILCMQEYLPQSIIELREIEINMQDVMFTTPVRKDFYEQYERVCDFFYNNSTDQKNIKKKKKKKTKVDNKESDITKIEDNVISLIEAIAKKSKGPLH